MSRQKEEEMKQQQRMAIIGDLIQKLRSNGRMDAQNRWWISELLAKDCEKAWTHTGWEETMHKWCDWLEHMKKKEKEKLEGMHQRKVEKMIKSAEGSAGLSTKSQSQRCGGEEYRSWRGRRIVAKQKGKKGQNTGTAMRRYRICKTSHGGMRT